MKIAIACAFLVACGGGSEDGAFSLAWTLSINGEDTDCATAGVATMQVVTNDGVATEEFFPCTDGMATTGARAPGDYNVTVLALDDGDGVVTSLGQLAQVVAGQTTDLGVFPFTFGAECDASSCPAGCCDDLNQCVISQNDAACGRGGVACVNCTLLAQVCEPVEGMCIE